MLCCDMLPLVHNSFMEFVTRTLKFARLTIREQGPWRETVIAIVTISPCYSGKQNLLINPLGI